MSNVDRDGRWWMAPDGRRHPGHLVALIVASILLIGGVGGALVVMAPAGADGTTRYVSSVGTDGGDCSSAMSPCATITYALNQANPGDTIEVSGTIDDNPIVTMPVTITQMPDGSPAAVDGGNNGSAITISGKNMTVSLVGLTIENGEAAQGGGVDNAGGSTVVITDSTISGNTAPSGSEGGGVFNNGTATISNSTISGNSAPGGGQGGGIYDNGTESITDSTISDNSAPDGGGQGGGIYDNGTDTVTDSTIWDNSAPDGGGQGGGIYDAGTDTITDSTISDNAVPDGGGQGGGVYSSGTTTIYDSTISGNTALNGQGGGIFNGNNNVLQGALGTSQCLKCQAPPSGVTLAGDIAATPGGAPPEGECAGGTVIDGGYNVDDDGTCGLSGTSVSDSATIDGYLGPLADNGGPTETITLLPGSLVAPNPAQAVIPPGFTASGALTPSCSQLDQRGSGRGEPCDMGAYALTVPSITSAASTTFTLGSAGSFQFTANSAQVPTFAEVGPLPSGVTLTPAGLLSGTPGPGTAGTYPMMVTASVGSFPGGGQSFTLNVLGPPTIASATTVTFSVGQPGKFVVKGAGVPAPALTEIGGLPAGITFTDNGNGTATVAGTPGPGTAGAYPTTVVAVNGTNPPAIKPLTVNVDQAPAITSEGPAGFTLGQPGSITVTGTGFPIPTVQISGPLPGGLSVSESANGSVTIAGTPNHLSKGPVTLTVVATNAAGSVSAPLVVSVSSGRSWLAGSDGSVYPEGGAVSLGSMQAFTLHSPVVGIAATPDGGGYWLVASDGGVFSIGDAAFFGSTGSLHLNEPIVGMAATPDGGGYWLVASDGGVFSFGDAAFFGSTGSLHLNKPIVGMAATPDGGGYWLVASDGGVFSFGDAAFFGSTGSLHLNKPIVGMAATPDGGGYWLVASDGGVFGFGDAPFLGSVATVGLGALNAPVVGIAASSNGAGYSLATASGDVIPFGNGVAGGGLGGLRAPIVGIASP
jgi:hypothetical protein